MLTPGEVPCHEMSNDEQFQKNFTCKLIVQLEFNNNIIWNVIFHRWKMLCLETNNYHQVPNCEQRNRYPFSFKTDIFVLSFTPPHYLEPLLTFDQMWRIWKRHCKIIGEKTERKLFAFNANSWTDIFFLELTLTNCPQAYFSFLWTCYRLIKRTRMKRWWRNVFGNFCSSCWK